MSGFRDQTSAKSTKKRKIKKPPEKHADEPGDDLKYVFVDDTSNKENVKFTREQKAKHKLIKPEKGKTVDINKLPKKEENEGDDGKEKGVPSKENTADALAEIDALFVDMKNIMESNIAARKIELQQIRQNNKKTKKEIINMSKLPEEAKKIEEMGIFDYVEGLSKSRARNKRKIEVPPVEQTEKKTEWLGESSDEDNENKVPLTKYLRSHNNDTGAVLNETPSNDVRKFKRRVPDECLTPEQLLERRRNDDAVWAQFVADTGFKSKSVLLKEKPPIRGQSMTKPTSSNLVEPNEKKEPAKTQKEEAPKQKVKKTVRFAGEDVEVENDLLIEAMEARFKKAAQKTQAKRIASGLDAGAPFGGVTALNALITKKSITTLEKSKLDWNQFKKQENIEEELQTHNRGKYGYLEQQDFLDRADYATFEIERDMREHERQTRMKQNPK